MDWRIETYNGELNGREFFFRKFVTIPANDPKEMYDHEHCEFCWRKITDLKLEEEHDEWGYMTFGYVGEMEERCSRTGFAQAVSMILKRNLDFVSKRSKNARNFSHR